MPNIVCFIRWRSIGRMGGCNMKKTYYIFDEFENVYMVGIPSLSEAEAKQGEIYHDMRESGMETWDMPDLNIGVWYGGEQG